jgi:hypothetical protein
MSSVGRTVPHETPTNLAQNFPHQRYCGWLQMDLASLNLEFSTGNWPSISHLNATCPIFKLFISPFVSTFLILNVSLFFMLFAVICTSSRMYIGVESHNKFFIFHFQVKINWTEISLFLWAKDTVNLILFYRFLK